MKTIEIPPEWSRSVVIVSDFSELEARSCLQPEEISAIEGFRLPKRRHESIAARMAAKQLALVRELIAHPQQAAVVNENERPLLKIGDRISELHLSLSHTDGLGAAALGERAIGIDIERVREIPRRAWKFFLQPEEIVSVQQTPGTAIDWWSAKEAAWKALSSSAQTTLKNVTLAPAPEHESRFSFRCGEESGEVEVRRIEQFVLALARSVQRHER